MICGLYVIYDNKADTAVGGVVQLISTDAAAVRMFAGVVGTPGTMVNEHPKDFSLLRVGHIDLVTLEIEPNLSSRHKPISTGDAIVREFERARNVKPDNVGDDLTQGPTVDPRQLSITGA